MIRSAWIALGVLAMGTVLALATDAAGPFRAEPGDRPSLSMECDIVHDRREMYACWNDLHVCYLWWGGVVNCLPWGSE